MTDYWLPEWWDWIEDWSECLTCLQYNHSRCISCEIPPGLLAMAQLVGGGVATVGGSMRGNCGIVNAHQAQCAARQHGVEPVNRQLDRQRQINAQVEREVLKRERH